MYEEQKFTCRQMTKQPAQSLTQRVWLARVRRRLSLVWEVDHRPQPPADGDAHPESVDREEEDSVQSERGTSEPDEGSGGDG